jgi:hypothetical protein
VSARPSFNDSAIVALFQDVASYIAAHWPGDAPAVVFGIRARWQQLNDGIGGANRIVVIPGTLDGDDGDAAGVVGPGSFEETGAARGLYTQAKAVTFSLWAGNDTTPDAITDEAAQQNAIEQMQEFVYRAVKASSFGGANAIWGKHKYNRKPAELRFGAEYLMNLELDSTFFDLDPVVIVPSGATVSRNPAT